MPLKKIKLEPVEMPEITADDTNVEVIPPVPCKEIDNGQECGTSLDFINVKRKGLDSGWVKLAALVYLPLIRQRF